MTKIELSAYPQWNSVSEAPILLLDGEGSLPPAAVGYYKLNYYRNRDDKKLIGHIPTHRYEYLVKMCNGI